MKKILWLTPVIVAMITVAVATNLPVKTNNQNSPTPQEGLNLDFPEDVMAVLERSCFDCHTNESSNFKGKSKLNFSKWDEYKSSKKIGKLDAICEDVKDGSMPKKKYVKKHPDKSMSHEDIDLICNWAADESKKLMGE